MLQTNLLALSLLMMEIEITQLFVETENNARKLGDTQSKKKTQHIAGGRKNSLKQNRIGHFEIKKLQISKTCKF
jgi:hypothetical protein